MEQPETIEEMLKDKNLKEAADSEYQSLMDNETWKLVKLPAGRSQLDANKSSKQSAQVMVKSNATKLNSWLRVTPKNPEKITLACRKILIYSYPVGFHHSKQHDNLPDGRGHSVPEWKNK